jgi:hypothetical protein
MRDRQTKSSGSMQTVTHHVGNRITCPSHLSRRGSVRGDETVHEYVVFPFPHKDLANGHLALRSGAGDIIQKRNNPCRILLTERYSRWRFIEYDALTFNDGVQGQGLWTRIAKRMGPDNIRHCPGCQRDGDDQGNRQKPSSIQPAHEVDSTESH